MEPNDQNPMEEEVTNQTIVVAWTVILAILGLIVGGITAFVWIVVKLISMIL
jgi:hypothetical protein